MRSASPQKAIGLMMFWDVGGRYLVSQFSHFFTDISGKSDTQGAFLSEIFWNLVNTLKILCINNTFSYCVIINYWWQRPWLTYFVIYMWLTDITTHLHHTHSGRVIKKVILSAAVKTRKEHCRGLGKMGWRQKNSFFITNTAPQDTEGENKMLKNGNYIIAGFSQECASPPPRTNDESSNHEIEHLRQFGDGSK